MDQKHAETATEQAFKSIKQMIFNYQLIPGQNIDYIQLVERLKLSKTPIINGLHRLEQEEFVVYVRNRGFYVKEIDINELNELFEIREALEILVAERCIKKQNPTILNEIEKAMMEHRKFHYDLITRKRQILDMAFHLKIAEMGGSRNLFKILSNVFERIYLRYRSEILPSQRAIQAINEHQMIFNSIKEKNSALAKRMVKIHVRGAKAVNIKAIEETKKGDNLYFPVFPLSPMRPGAREQQEEEGSLKAGQLSFPHGFKEG
jgi:DNA-binding GntR family transcriptional regulator